MLHYDKRLPEKEGACSGIHLIGGPGALRSLSAIVGFLLLLGKSEIKAVKSQIGISGGSLPLVLLAAGYTAEEILSYVLNLRFSSLVDWGRSSYVVVASHLSSGRRRAEFPSDGVYHTSKLGEEIERLVADRTAGWPKDFYAVAVDGTPADTTEERTRVPPQVLFGASGYWRRRQDGTMEQVSDEPAPLGRALRASCAVPMILEPVKITTTASKNLLLFDGAISWEGHIPLGLIDSIAPANEQLIVDVGDEPGRYVRAYARVMKLVCGGRCVGTNNTGTIACDKNRILITPMITAVRSFDFDASRDVKWLAISEGFLSAVEVLAERQLLTGKNLTEAQEIGDVMIEVARGAALDKKFHVSSRIEHALSLRGWV